MAKIIKRERLVPNIHYLEIEAPEIARKCQPGQFIIIMPDENGERIPLTLADWDRTRGTVTCVFLVVGTSTHKLSFLQAGDDIPVVVGPLGRPTKIEKLGTVMVVGGCYGIGAIYPVARAYKHLGNKVLTLIDVKADYLFYWKEKFKEISDEIFVSSRDYVYDCQGYVPRVLKMVLKEKKQKINRVYASGCTYLLYTCAKATQPASIETIVALNPIMVDGTGMCGACRVTVGGKTKFACVDGPDFDGHQVDWEELFARRKSYFDDEIQSLCYWERKTFP